MTAYVSVDHCGTKTQLHAVMRNAHMAGFTHRACLLVMFPSQTNGTALTALDYSSLRDIPGSSLVSTLKPRLRHQPQLILPYCTALFASAKLKLQCQTNLWNAMALIAPMAIFFTCNA